MHAAARLADGRVLITGGMTRDVVCDRRRRRSSTRRRGRSARVGPMRDARADHAATTLADGRVLIVGGSTFSSNPTTARCPRRSCSIRRRARSSPRARSPPNDPASATVRLPDGRVLVNGGSNAFGSPRTAELFDPATGRFEQAGTSSTPHGDAWLGALPDGHVLVLGEAQDHSAGAPELWSALEHPRPAPEDRAAAGPGFAPVDTETMLLLAGHTATVLADGRILVTGGSDVTAPDTEAARVRRDLRPEDRPISTRGRHVGPPVRSRRGPAPGWSRVHRRWRGHALSGGWSVRLSGPSAELFDPVTARFTTLAAKLGPVLPRSREWPPSAALLADGRVLFIGPKRVVTIVDPATGDVAAGSDPPRRRAGLAGPAGGRPGHHPRSRGRGAVPVDLRRRESGSRGRSRRAGTGMPRSPSPTAGCCSFATPARLPSTTRRRPP